MRIWSVVWAGVALTGLLNAGTAQAQDAAAMAAQQAAQQAAQANQQAMDQAIQASQQATQQAQQANQRAMDEMQRASQQAAATAPTSLRMPGAPQFSMKVGRYPGAITVRLKTRARSAAIFYTTDGWTPTTESTRYVGPIRITETTRLQAIAVSPNLIRTFVSSAVYTLPPTADAGLDAAIAALPNQSESTATVSLEEGTPVFLKFAAPVSSKTAQIGDHVSLTLARDLLVDGVVVARRGARAIGTVLLADHAIRGGEPGVLQFSVDTLQLPQGTLPLRGFEELDGVNHQIKAGAWNILPLGGAFVRGEEAEIPIGMPLTAYVAEGTTIDTASLR
jgi:chitobiase/beta-hexosaminidase-like protein